jgi:DNA invertase Pin-like site-specific DNA recombinase
MVRRSGDGRLRHKEPVAADPDDGRDHVPDDCARVLGVRPTVSTRSSLKLFRDTGSSSVIPNPRFDSLAPLWNQWSRMKRAVLYARVSTDAQQKEGTIASQVLELKSQIAAAGDVLVKEYVDNGYSGSLLDRPGLETLRRDVRTPLFDAVYFLDTDRIARDVAYQTIILGELLKYGKQIIIKGRDYVNNPENKFTITVLGAVAELERAKIIERTTRGRLHRLRMGELSSHGHRIYGYDYVRKSATAPAALVINEEQAPVVRSIFEMFASGRFGLVTISRFLEERRLPTRLGRPLWHRDQIKFMLKNETYTGTRYFNRITHATEAFREGGQVIRGRWVYRDRAEWIPVKVPPIVSRTRDCACTRSDTAGPSRTTSCRAWSNAACAAADVPLREATTRSCARRGGSACITGPRTAAIGVPRRTCTIGRGSSAAATPRSAPISSKAKCSR